MVPTRESTLRVQAPPKSSHLKLERSRSAAGSGKVQPHTRTFLTEHWQVLFACGVALADVVALFAGYKISGPTAISEYHVARRVISVWYVGSYFVIVGAAGLYRRPYTAAARSQLRRCLKGH